MQGVWIIFLIFAPRHRLWVLIRLFFCKIGGVCRGYGLFFLFLLRDIGCGYSLDFFCKKRWGLQGVWIIFLIFAPRHRLWVLIRFFCKKGGVCRGMDYFFIFALRLQGYGLFFLFLLRDIGCGYSLDFFLLTLKSSNELLRTIS